MQFEHRLRSGQAGQYPFQVNSFCLGAIEEDMSNGGMLRKESLKVIGDNGSVIDVCIEASFPGTGFQYIPDGDTMQCQLIRLLLVICCGDSEKFSHNWPETVAGMRVVALLCQGFAPGHTAQDQYSCIRAAQRRESVDFSHFAASFRG